MNFTLSETQEMLRESARDFLAEKCPKSYVRQMETDENGYSPALWKEMAELGWLGLALPELYGGFGMEFIDLAVLLEERVDKRQPVSSVVLHEVLGCF